MHRSRWDTSHVAASDRSLMQCMLYIAAVFVAAAPAMAQQDSIDIRLNADTSRARSLPPVVVHAQSIVAQSASAAHSTSILTRATIDAAQARDASDVVALVPG